MAIFRITNECLFDETIFDVIMDSFDSVEEIKDEFKNCSDEMCHVKVLRVINDEVPKEDKIICPMIYAGFDGVRPFIISYE